MNEFMKTLCFAALAAGLVITALFAVPRHRPPHAFDDVHQPFYPEFTDPNAATALEIIEFDEKLALVHPFKVEFKNGRWRLPSHSDYPADAKERLAKTAVSVMDLRRDRLQSDRTQDHKDLGVIDPTEDSPSLEGRGKRITLRDAGGKVLVDFIVGKETREGSGMRYMRLPGQKRTYAVQMKEEISSKFEDWIETDLLKLSASDIRKMILDSYSLDEQTGDLKDRARHTVSRTDATASWTISDITDQEEPNTETLSQMVSALDDLKIVGVRRKPSGLTRDLKADRDLRTAGAFLELKSKGFYVIESGDIISNEGELQAHLQNGVVYTLRFGDALFGIGEELTAGTEAPKKESSPGTEEKKPEGTENRYLLVTVRFDESLIPTAPTPPAEFKPDPAWTEEQKKTEEEKYKKAKEEYEKQKKEHEEKIASGKKTAQQLTDRFADWYYVISADYFKKLRRSRADLVKAKEAPKPGQPGDGHDHDEKKPDDPK